MILAYLGLTAFLKFRIISYHFQYYSSTDRSQKKNSNRFFYQTNKPKDDPWSTIESNERVESNVTNGFSPKFGKPIKNENKTLSSHSGKKIIFFFLPSGAEKILRHVAIYGIFKAAKSPDAIAAMH